MLYNKLVCYVCQTIHIKPDDCQSANIIVAGYGVCFRHQFIIERALGLEKQREAIIKERDKELS